MPPVTSRQPSRRTTPPRLLAVIVALALLPAASAADTDVTATAAPPGPVASSWEWPLGASGTPRVTRHFEAPDSQWGPGHRGVDLPAVANDAVRSPADGTVAFASTVVDRPVLSIDHGNGLRTSLEPVRADVDVGDAVSAGQVVGTVADGGHCGTGCLHWGLRHHGVYIDPVPAVRDLRPSVLLPAPDR